MRFILAPRAPLMATAFPWPFSNPLPVQRVEDNRFIDPVDELGPEVVAE
ncbi:MAG: hypothetical protein ACXIUL_05495 [Wenzhouxiangella sp.]